MKVSLSVKGVPMAKTTVGLVLVVDIRLIRESNGTL